MITLPTGFNISLFVAENLTLIIGMVGVSAIFLALVIILKYMNYTKFIG